MSKNRGRILCEATVAKEFRELCTTLQIRPAALLDYLFREHNNSLTEESVEAYDYLSDLNLTVMGSFGVPKWVQLWVKDMASSYRTRMHIISTIIIQDNLVTLKTNPEIFPWIQEQALNIDSSAKTRPLTKVVTIKKSLHKRIQNYLDAISETREDRLTIVSYVEHTLLGFPQNEIIRAANKLALEVAQVVEVGKREELKSVRIPYDVADFLSEVAEITGASRGAILEYILEKDLDAAQEEITLNKQLLPTNLRERWVVLMRDLIELDKESKRLEE